MHRSLALVLLSSAALVGATAPSVAARPSLVSASAQQALGLSEARAAERRLWVEAENHAALQRSWSTSSTPAPRSIFKAEPLDLQPGELVSASGMLQVILQVILREDGTARVNDSEVEETFVARGIDFDADLGLLAIAAVSQVLLYAPETGEVTVLAAPAEDESFAFVNDVLFDGRGNLILADQGAVIGTLEPADGRIWEYAVAEGSFRRVAAKRDMSDPKFLALDSKGRVYILDGNAGPLISPLLDLRYDRLLRIKGAKRRGAKKTYVEGGIIATAMNIDADDRIWLGSVSEFLLLEGKSLSYPCLVPGPFEYVHDIEIPARGDSFFLDGVAGRGDGRVLSGVSPRCRVIAVGTGSRLDAARGIALVGEPTAEPEG